SYHDVAFPISVKIADGNFTNRANGSRIIDDIEGHLGEREVAEIKQGQGAEEGNRSCFEACHPNIDLSNIFNPCSHPSTAESSLEQGRSEERRVGKEYRSRA